MIKIFGKDYITVAERLKLANGDLLSVNTEVLYQEPVVIKATITIRKIDGGNILTFTGISAANPTKMIEKSSPYEVAETSAVGRALGFAGYGVTDSIATADEMAKVTDTPNSAPQSTTQPDIDPEWVKGSQKCSECGTLGKYHKKGCKNEKN
jgi:hypothetical protein